ncbi:hypothetical protein GGX14DRAFT_408114 [Mycena pura]|uniref:Uncharacterized protein n=1 Tax=Mycena pura TaxID=153505 RepID=A0AAD6UMA1_9AGAR|nr:hypothetical protein GGX14DRAFT_408114 [Mycena pura]
MSATRLYAARSHAPRAARPAAVNARLVLRLRLEGSLKNRDNKYGSDASSAAVVLARGRGARSLLGISSRAHGRLDNFHSVIHASAPSLIPAAARHPYAVVHRPSSDFVKTGSAWAETAGASVAGGPSFSPFTSFFFSSSSLRNTPLEIHNARAVSDGTPRAVRDPHSPRASLDAPLSPSAMPQFANSSMRSTVKPATNEPMSALRGTAVFKTSTSGSNSGVIDCYASLSEPKRSVGGVWWSWTAELHAM